MPDRGGQCVSADRLTDHRGRIGYEGKLSFKITLNIASTVLVEQVFELLRE